MKELLLVILFLSRTTSALEALESTQMRLIKDLVASDNTTSLVNFVGCFDPDSIHDGARQLPTSVGFYASLHLLNITYERPKAQHKLYITDFKRCRELFSQFQKMNKLFLGFPFKWVIFVDESDIDFFLTVDVLLSSNVVLVLDEEGGSGYKMIQVYKIKEFSTKLRIEIYGHWNESHGFTDERSSKVLSWRRKDLQGELMTMVGITMDNRSYTLFYSRREKQTDPVFRMLFNLHNIILDTFNSTVRYVFTSKFGYDETGIWVGAYGNLINEHADISLTPFFLYAERVEVIDYIGTLTPFYGYFIFRAPSLSSIANIYFLPFSRLVWISLGVSALICTVSIYFLKRLEERLLDHEVQTVFTDTILLTVSAICQMGTNLEARMYSSRVLVFFLFMTFVFVYTSYTASIVGLLQTSTNSIQTLQDLLNSKLKLGVEDTLYNRYYFGQSSDPVRIQINEQKVAPSGETPHFFDRKTGVALLRNSSFAYFGEERPIYREIEDTFYEEEKCGLKQMRYYEFAEPYQGLAKNSPIKEMTKIVTSKLREYAISQVERKRLYKEKPLCVVGNGQKFESVDLESVNGAIIFYGYGLAASFILFLMEIMHQLAVKICKKREVGDEIE